LQSFEFSVEPSRA